MAEALQFWTFAAVWSWKTLKRETGGQIRERFLQQFHLQLLTNIFASSFLDDSLILHREMGPDISVLTLFCFPEKCDDSKHTNFF